MNNESSPPFHLASYCITVNDYHCHTSEAFIATTIWRNRTAPPLRININKKEVIIRFSIYLEVIFCRMIKIINLPVAGVVGVETFPFKISPVIKFRRKLVFCVGEKD